MTVTWEPVPGKCRWWREVPCDEDRFDRSLKPEQRRVDCQCFVEGKAWRHPQSEVPKDCPDARSCRYYIKNI